ncbi:hypothetical protein [Novosphingobium gossypii]|uniref:hypothetical protein n=1 Tax=Novosphingobium gossypii TaxID=1604774 RepID=UPI003D1AB694
MGKPALGRMNRLAIDVLEAARDLGEKEPIKPGPEVRLALAWLNLNGVSEDWQVKQYWTALPSRPSTPTWGPTAAPAT